MLYVYIFFMAFIMATRYMNQFIPIPILSFCYKMYTSRKVLKLQNIHVASGILINAALCVNEVMGTSWTYSPAVLYPRIVSKRYRRTAISKQCILYVILSFISYYAMHNNGNSTSQDAIVCSRFVAAICFAVTCP